MPLSDFTPADSAAPDGGKLYLIREETLKKLLQRAECDPSQFDVKETPDARIYTLRDISGGEPPLEETTGWYGSIQLNYNPAFGSTQYITLVVVAGSITQVFDHYGEIASGGSASLYLIDT